MKITTPLTSVSIAALFEELTSRVLQLQFDAGRVRSVGRLRELVQHAVHAGELCGAAARLDAVALRLSQVLDEATVSAHEPNPDAETAAKLAAARDDRRALWQAIDRMRIECQTEATRLLAEGHRRHAHVRNVMGDALAPEVPLRRRVGQWLLAQSARMAQRGAA